MTKNPYDRGTIRVDKKIENAFFVRVHWNTKRAFPVRIRVCELELASRIIRFISSLIVHHALVYSSRLVARLFVFRFSVLRGVARTVHRKMYSQKKKNGTIPSGERTISECTVNVLVINFFQVWDLSHWPIFVTFLQTCASFHLSNFVTSEFQGLHLKAWKALPIQKFP